MIFSKIVAVGVLWDHYYRLFGLRAIILIAYRVHRRMPVLRKTLRAWWWTLPRAFFSPTCRIAIPTTSRRQIGDRTWFSNRFPDAHERRLEAAERIRQNQFCFLGTGVVAWGDPIDWHHDLKSGHRWPARFYVDYADQDLMPGHGADVKVPWELSRLQHLVTLGQVWWSTGDEAWGATYFTQWESWAQANPAPYGINWTNAMEVAIRSVNLSFSQRLLFDAQGWTDSRRSAFLGMLRQHGTFIERNLEVGVRDGKIVTGNHYLANLCGLACLGLSYPEMPEAKRWRSVALKALEEEMQHQVLSDGLCFESSTGYHALAIELLLLPALLARRAGHEMSAGYWARLELMIEAVLYLTRPDGRMPQIGDSDDGRLMILSGYPDWSRNDHRHLLALGAALFGRSDFKAMAQDCDEEVFWLMGRDAVNRFDAADTEYESLDSRAFPESGLYVIRGGNGRDYGVVKAGTRSADAPSGHAHNDTLSVELWSGGEPVFVDPGTYCYTSDLAMRNRFRSTSAHNTAMVDGAEISEIPESEPFALGSPAGVRLLEWSLDDDESRVAATHDGYGRLAPPVSVRRDVHYARDSGVWTLTDRLEGEGAHTAVWHWQSADDMVVREDSDAPGGTVINLTTSTALIRVVVKPAFLESSHSIDKGMVSTSYGVKHDADCLRLAVEFQNRCSVSLTVSPRATTTQTFLLPSDSR